MKIKATALPFGIGCRFYLCQNSNGRDCYEAHSRYYGADHSGAVCECGFELKSKLLYVEDGESRSFLAFFYLVCLGLEEFCAFIAKEYRANKPYHDHRDDEKEIVLR